ncbi:myelin regulatory factor-like protein isoform X1 [Poecilia reticulata]|uniref:myelin regulatory factor-like protein isoform X1 n=1 Tax=Poecilia reticulata TaxID=8081 RepID=UPI0004A499B7|nr:PREDICTED: myelin regulatory factor-like protein isoform X1 [Poecilia reticulata]
MHGSMEPGASGPPLQVLGENEALQQFFSGQDVRSVLDSSVAVDTSILEQYLSNDMDPSSFMLPESPPDSSSEACSPPQIPDLGYERSCWPIRPEAFQPATYCHFKNRGSTPLDSDRLTRATSCRLKDGGGGTAHSDFLTHNQLCGLGLTDSSVKSRTPPDPHVLPVHQDTNHPPEHYLNSGSILQGYTPPTPPSPPLPPTSTYMSTMTDPGLVQNLPVSSSHCLLGSVSTSHPCSQDSKKRRRSESEESFAAVDAAGCERDGTHNAGTGNTLIGPGPGSSRLLRWEHYRREHWSTLCNTSYQTLAPPEYHIDTDKGFNYSPADEAFVCQKKNHFQVTVHIGVAAEPHYVRTPSGLQKIDHFQIKVFGIKLETPGHEVTIEQSQPDRSKKPFHPFRVSLPCGKITTVTLGRLHFSETTANNMRKKGKPNPDQRYFQMVVGLYAAVKDETFLLTGLVSEKIIVRASNPGQFETDSDTLWQRGSAPDAAVCYGRVGINTDSPDEALVVCGNAKVMGAIMQPSDNRAKQNVQEVDSEQLLKRINQMRIVEFDYRPEFASNMGIDHAHQTGVIAQEVKELLPSAVMEVGDVVCSDGEVIQNFLMVDKEQIFMENVGAVQQLTKLTDNLETRIQELEGWNRRLAKLKSLTGSLRSTSSKAQANASVPPTPEPGRTATTQKNVWGQKFIQILQNKIFLASIFTFVITMAVCIISVSVLYLVTVKAVDIENLPNNSSSTVLPMWTEESPTAVSAPTTAVPKTTPPGSWPPDVSFCDLLFCNEVFCCPSSPVGSTFSIRPTSDPARNSTRTGAGKETINHLKATGDWRNTTIHTFMIKENNQVIDGKYCMRDECGPERYIFRVPISQFVPVNMRVTLLMSSSELLVVHLCDVDETTPCSAITKERDDSEYRYPSNTQGEHEWPLHVARLHYSSYHFRSSVAGQANCSTDHHYAGALFTDYYFHFYRRCTKT